MSPQLLWLHSFMTTSCKKWNWARLGHNPGLIRVLKGKKSIGVFQTLPCSLLKNSRRCNQMPNCSAAPTAAARQEKLHRPWSETLTEAAQKRKVEEIEEN